MPKIDTEWFHAQITRQFGSLRRFAPLMRTRGGKPLLQSGLTRLLRGEHEMLVSQAAELSRLLQVPIVVIIEKAGVEIPQVRERKARLLVHSLKDPSSKRIDKTSTPRSKMRQAPRTTR